MLKNYLLSLLIVLLLGVNAQVIAQENETTYEVSAFGSLANHSETPFWMVSNQWGIVPLKSGNGYGRAGVYHNQAFNNGFSWGGGVDLILAAPRDKHVYIQQVYLQARYKALQLSIGSKESHVSLWNERLSSGDLAHSINARPIPEINLSISEFLSVPFTNHWLQFKGDFALARSFDSGYLRNFVKSDQVYIEKVLWHHKSLHLKIGNTSSFPLTFAFGVQHWAQWGGTSTDTKLENRKQPQSIKDFARIVLGRTGGEDSSNSSQINALGNHYGAYDFKLSFEQQDYSLHAYYQHFFEDGSGMEFKNGTDGLWGFEVNLHAFPYLRSVLFEYMTTMNQSGTMHFISFDRDKYPGARGGGADNYYNNGEYVTGASYFNRGLGSPLVPSPEYNDGQLGFNRNRGKNWHFAAEGDFSDRLSYRLRFSVMNNYGTMARPLFAMQSGTSTMVDMTYNHPSLKGWRFGGGLAFDTGDIFRDQVGFFFSIRKEGLIKKWME